MKAEIYYTLETGDQHYAKRLGECLNMVNFVFTHNPELKIVRRVEHQKPKDYYNPHSRIFNGGPFTREQLDTWSEWVDKVIAKGHESIPLQHPAYRTGHEMALAHFRETADAFLDLFEEHKLNVLDSSCSNVYT